MRRSLSQVAGKSKTMTKIPSITSRLIHEPAFRREMAPHILFAIASMVFFVWIVYDTKQSVIAERDRLEQRISAIERTLAELPVAAPAKARP